MKTVCLMLGLMGFLAQGQGAVGCPSNDPCPDPSRPWMRGAVEKSCTMTDADRQRWQKQEPNRLILVCACQHVCDPDGPQAPETQGRQWDARCEARCNPHNCRCRNPCDS